MQGCLDWIPTRDSPRGRLVLTALDAFGNRGYEGVAVAELARAAGTTTGPLYHHFGSKLGLYDVIRTDVERRVLDRMEGALAAARGPGAVSAALVVAFDYVERAGYLRAAGRAPSRTRRRSGRGAAGGPPRRGSARRDARRRVAGRAGRVRGGRRAGGGPPCARGARARRRGLNGVGRSRGSPDAGQTTAGAPRRRTISERSCATRALSAPPAAASSCARSSAARSTCFAAWWRW